jgi:hypothetical protein
LQIYYSLKRRNSYKIQKLNDLATLTFANSASSSASYHHHHRASNSASSTTTSYIECIENSGSSPLVNSNSGSSGKLPLREICISLPPAKPTLNESKPQLSIDSSKMKAKTLIERYESHFFSFLV